MSVNAKVHKSQDSDLMTVESGGEIKVATGGKITNNGTQASHIVDIADAASGAEIATAVNAILLALEGIGVVASE